MARRPQVKRASLDGIPVFHAGGDGPVRAGLFFRVGRQDERAADAGITHLVEHLALFRFGQQHYEYNGSVDPTWTTFWCFGDEREVAGFFSDVVRNLGDLPLDRLEDEQRVLLDEASRQPGSNFDHHLSLRYGLRGPGVSYLDELGLYRIGPEDVRAWAAKYFTAGNAAMVWTGAKLALRELSLPAGERMAPVTPPELVTQPTWAVDGPNLVSASVLLPRGMGSLGATRILSRRLQQVLRYEKGVSYDVSMAYHPLTPDYGQALIGATCGQTGASAVRDVFVEEIERFRQEGPSAEDLASDLERIKREIEPFPALAEAARMAALEVLGAPVETDDELERRAALVTPDVARATFATAADRLLLTLPPAAPGPTSGYVAYPVHTPGTVEGVQYHDVRERSTTMRNEFPIVAIGDEGASMLYPDGSSVRVLWSQCVLLVLGRDRSLSIVDATGSHVSFHPNFLAKAANVTEVVMSHVPESRVVRLPFDATAVPTPPARSKIALYLAGAGLWLITSIGAAGSGLTASRGWLPNGVTPATQLAGIALMVAGGSLPILALAAYRHRIAGWTAARIALVPLLVGIVAWAAAGLNVAYVWPAIIAAVIAGRSARLSSLVPGTGPEPASQPGGPAD